MTGANHELADFLRRARAAVDPADTALPVDGRIRRVPGLRREEVAMLAGVSTDYYTRLEQGRRIVPSTQVLDAIARALRLDAAARLHLQNLVGASTPSRIRTRPSVQRVRSGMYQLLDAIEQPALLLGRRSDVLATNRLGRALFADFDRMLPKERNYARWILLNDGARSLFVDWEEHARNAVANLRLDAGNYPDDQALQRLIGELSVASPEFAAWWAEHHVHLLTFGSKRLRHPIVGELTVEFETVRAVGDADQMLFVYSTQPNSSSRHALELLASWVEPEHTGAIPQGGNRNGID